MPAIHPIAAILRTFRGEFFSVGVYSFVANLLMLTPALYMLQVYDRVLVSQSGMTLAVLSLVALFFFTVMGAAEWTRSRVLVRTGVRLDEAVNSQVFRANFAAALEQGGRSPAQAFTDLVNLRQFITGNGVFAFFDAPWLPIYIGVLYLLHPLLGASAAVFALVLVGLVWLNHHLTKPSTQALLDSTAEVNAFLYSKLRNAEVVEALGMLPHLRRRWQNRQNRVLAASTESQDRALKLQAVTKFTRFAQQSLMLGVGALLVIEGELTLGGMIAGSILVGRALAPIDVLAASWKAAFTAWAAYRSLGALLLSYPARHGQAVDGPPHGAVRIEGLTATAPQRASPILSGIELEFAPGEVVAIVGPSGSGKSTLARAVVGIWPHRQGRVLFDGVPIEYYDREQLGPHIGYLPQDVELLEGTIAENIARFGEVDAERVIEAARRTGIHEMILRFPQGYDTPVGLGGMALSGGQRQRIGLARAIYGEPALIVLDEPNSNLDDAGEAALQETLRQLKALGKTLIVITHRPQALAVADRILVLIDGQVRLFGPRDAVLAALTPPHTPSPMPAPV